MNGPSPQFWATEATLALLRSDYTAAATAVQRCLRLDPENPVALRIAVELQGP